MKYYGKICFSRTVENAEHPGLFEEEVTERNYFGDVIKLSRRWNDGNKINADLDISHQISIVSDPFAQENFVNIRYVEWLGKKWKISNVEIQYPRLILTIGGLYNE